MAWFLVAMAMHPSVQTKARQELDTVLGTSRLPDFEDLDSMPFLQATYMETLRWIPVVPMGVPHRVMEEDEYNGYRIPKGSTIIPVSLFTKPRTRTLTDVRLFRRMCGKLSALGLLCRKHD